MHVTETKYRDETRTNVRYNLMTDFGYVIISMTALNNKEADCFFGGVMLTKAKKTHHQIYRNRSKKV